VDVATHLNFPRPIEDFGQTLGRWGVGQGPFLVIPFVGPSNLRDGLSIIPDVYAISSIRNQYFSDPANIAYTVMYPIDGRANTPFRYYENGSPFEYQMVRWLISTKRKLDVDE
jgi:phospholipid-binding lipoprotein MlaA